MKTKFKISNRILSLVLALVMVLGMMPMMSMTAHAAIIGTVNDNITWSYDETTRTLTFSGSGDLPNAPLTMTKPHYFDTDKIVVGDGITSIGDQNFEFYNYITSVELPNTIKSIGLKAFADTMLLKKITIPDSVTTIGRMSFEYSALETITIPSSVTSIGNLAFVHCDELKTVIIQGSATLDEKAFYFCENIETVSYGGTVDKIGENAFNGNTGKCYSFTMKEGVGTSGAGAFDKIDLENITLIDNAGNDVTEKYSLSKSNGALVIKGNLALVHNGNSLGAIGKISDFTYSGAALQPDVVVTWNGKTLVNGTDYSVNYVNNTNVGTATVTVIGQGNYTGILSANFQINELDISKTTVEYKKSWNYTGSAIEPEITVKTNDVTLQKDRDYTVEYHSNVSAGTGKITITGKGDCIGSVTKDFSISEAALTDVSAEQVGTLTYDGGNALTPDVHATATTLDGSGYTFTYSTEQDGTYGTAVPTFTEAGSHTVYYKVTAPNHATQGGNFTVNVNPGAFTDVSVKQVGTLTYDGGNALTPDVHATATTLDGSEYTFTYSTEQDGTYGTAVPTVTQAGSYTFYYKVTAPNHTTQGGRFIVSVNRAKGIASVSVEDWLYGTTPNEPIPVSSTNGTDNVGYWYKVKGADDRTYRYGNVPAEIGEYTIKAVFAATKNYKEVTTTADFQILYNPDVPPPKPITADMISIVSPSYDGSEHHIENYITVKDGTKTLEYDRDWNIAVGSHPDFMNAGSFTISVVGMGDFYYGWVDMTFTINKALLTVTAEDKTTTYGDVAPEYTVTYDGFKGNDNESVLDGALAFDCGYAQFKDKGEYTIKASGYTSDNYIINYVDGKLNVSAKPITVTIQNATSVYGDEIVALTATDNGIVNNDKDVYKLTTTASKTADVGKYDIIGEALDGNYIITFTKETDAYEITTRELTVSVVVANKKYDGLNTAAITSAVLNNVANNDAVALVNGTATFTSVNVADGIAISLTDFALSGEADVLKNYTLTQPIGIKANITNDWTPNEYVVSTPNSNGWLNADLVITAADGYELSLTNTADGVWSETLTGAVEGADSSVTFYVRNKADGTISLAKTENYKLDKNTEATTTTGKVEFVERNSWQEFVNNITFGLFFKDKVTVKAEATDALSGVASIEYAVSDKSLTLDEVKAITEWTAMPADGVGVTVEDAKKFVYFIRITDNAGNVTYLSTDGAEYDTTAPVISGAQNGKTYYTTQKVTVTDKNDVSVTLNGETAEANITLDGNKEVTYIIVATDQAGNSTTVTVTMKPIRALAEATNDLTNDNVTSANTSTLETLVEKLDELIADNDTTDVERETLEQHRAIAESLLDTVENAAEATETENTEKVKDVTAENVTPDDKTDLENAKADLEKALEDNGGNYTDEEKKAIEDELGRIDDALEIIGNVEEVEELIGKLPENITKNDEDAIKAADDALGALTDYEKSLVDEDAKKALDDAKAVLAELNKPADNTSPNTGYNSHIMLWFVLLFISGGAVVTLTVVDRKRRTAK